MITKTQANEIRLAAIAAALAALPQKLENAIALAASQGITSIDFPYFPATSAQANAFIASTMVPAGWTVVNNNILSPGNFSITVS